MPRFALASCRLVPTKLEPEYAVETFSTPKKSTSRYYYPYRVSGSSLVRASCAESAAAKGMASGGKALQLPASVCEI